MRRLRLGLVVVTLVVFQTTFFEHVRVLDVIPDLCLVATIAVAYEDGPVTGAIFGFLSGLSIDLFLSTPVGLSALAFSVTGYAMGVLQGGLVYATIWITPVLGLLGGLAGGLLFATAGEIAGERGLLSGHGVELIFLAALYDALIAPLVFRLIRWAAHDADSARGPRR